MLFSLFTIPDPDTLMASSSTYATSIGNQLLNIVGLVVGVIAGSLLLVKLIQLLIGAVKKVLGVRRRRGGRRRR